MPELLLRNNLLRSKQLACFNYFGKLHKNSAHSTKYFDLFNSATGKLLHRHLETQIFKLLFLLLPLLCHTLQLLLVLYQHFNILIEVFDRIDRFSVTIQICGLVLGKTFLFSPCINLSISFYRQLFVLISFDSASLLCQVLCHLVIESNSILRSYNVLRICLKNKSLKQVWLLTIDRHLG